MAKDWVGGALMEKVSRTEHVFSTTPRFGFGWWFDYFWKERATKGEEDRGPRERLMEDILALLFADDFPPDIASADFKTMRIARDRVAAAFTPPLPQPADLNTHPQKYRELLTRVMSIGFRELPTATLASQAEGKAKEMFRDLLEVDRNGSRMPVAIAYRGETRDFDTVALHGGATPRSQLGRLVNMNMEAPWHPFSDPRIASRSYARGASGDNCLYSVNSIADGLDVPVGFPLIEDPNIFSIPDPGGGGHDVSSWTYAMLRQARQSQLPPARHLAAPDRKAPIVLAKCTISGVPGKRSGIFMATENHVYAIRLEAAMHTQEFVEGNFGIVKGQCKERGVGAIALDQYVAGARVRRMHLGPARTCGVTGFVQERRFMIDGKWRDEVTAKELSAAHFNNDAKAGLDALEIIRGHFGDGTVPKVVEGERVHSMCPLPAMHIVAIEQWDLTIEQLHSYKQRNDSSLYFAPFA